MLKLKNLINYHIIINFHTFSEKIQKKKFCYNFLQFHNIAYEHQNRSHHIRKFNTTILIKNLFPSDNYQKSFRLKCVFTIDFLRINFEFIIENDKRRENTKRNGRNRRFSRLYINLACFSHSKCKASEKLGQHN